MVQVGRYLRKSQKVGPALRSDHVSPEVLKTPKYKHYRTPALETSVQKRHGPGGAGGDTGMTTGKGSIAPLL